MIDNNKLISPVKKLKPEYEEQTLCNEKENKVEMEPYSIENLGVVNPGYYTNKYCVNGGLTPKDFSSLKKEYASAGLRHAEEVAKTQELERRETIKLLAKEQELKMKAYAQACIEDYRDLKSVKVFLLGDKVKVVIQRENGDFRNPKNLIDQPFLGATKYISEGPNPLEIMVLTFLKKGEPYEVLYNPKLVKNSSYELIGLLKANGITVNVSRRMRADIEEELFFFLENNSIVQAIPLNLGYYKDSRGRWHLSKPGDLHMVNLKEREANNG